MQALEGHSDRRALAERLKSVSVEEVSQFPVAAIEEVSTLDRAQVLAVQVQYSQSKTIPSTFQLRTIYSFSCVSIFDVICDHLECRVDATNQMFDMFSQAALTQEVALVQGDS